MGKLLKRMWTVIAQFKKYINILLKTRYWVLFYTPKEIHRNSSARKQTGKQNNVVEDFFSGPKLYSGTS